MRRLALVAFAFSIGLAAQTLELSAPPAPPCNCFGKEKEKILVDAVRAAEKSSGASSAKAGNARLKLANLYFLRTEFDKAERLLRANIQLSSANEAIVLDSNIRLSSVMLQRKRMPEAAKFAATAHSLASTTQSPDLKVRALEQRADVQMACDQLIAAEQSLNQALNLSAKLRPADPLREAILLEKTASFLRQSGKPAAAESPLLKAISIRDKLHPPGHPNISWDQELLASIYTQSKQYAKAETLLKRVLTDKQALVGPGDPVLLPTLSSYATALEQLGKPKEAAAARARAQSILDGLAKRAASQQPVPHK